MIDVSRINTTDELLRQAKWLEGKTLAEVSEEIKRVPYSVITGENNTARVTISDRVYSPPEISAMILQKMKQTAEDYLGSKITDAVITVPAYFNDKARKDTIKAQVHKT